MSQVILLGPPGSGKGTQATLLAKAQGVPSLSTGDLLRHEVAAQSALGKQVQVVMAEGKLVSDDLVIAIIQAQLTSSRCQSGVILDGFPRTLAQAESLAAFWQPSHVFSFTLSDDAIVTRMAGRRVHPASGRTYHTVYCPPRQEGVDDLTGEALVIRPDDQPETVRHRLRVYHQDTAPLLRYYQAHDGFRTIAADQDPEVIHSLICRELA